MERVPLFTLVVITLLQLCRAQTSNSTPEWYAANDINDTSFSPKPITELFSTETSFSPEDPIVVLSPSSSLPSNRGIVSSPTPITQYSDVTESLPPNVIPLSSTELPQSSPETSPAFQTTITDSQSETLSTIPQEAPNTESNSIPRTTQNLPLPSQAPAVPRENVVQNVRPSQPPLISSRIPQQQAPPRNIQFLLPTQTGNRVFQGQQLTSIGQPNVFLLYEQPPQNIRNLPPVNLPVPPLSPQLSMPLRDPQQQIVARPPNVMRQQPQVPIQFPSQPNPVPPFNSPPPNIIQSPRPNNQQQTIQAPANQTPSVNQQSTNNQQMNNPINNPAPVNQMPSIQQANARNQQPPIQMTSPPVTTVVRRRPLRQRNRVNSGRINNRGGPRPQIPNNVPCQNNTAPIPPSTATNPQNPVITIRLRPTTMARNSLQINPAPNTKNSTTVRPRQSSQLNTRNYERCLNSCRDKKDRICAGPERDTQINPDNLKGFPSMCHMACHNTFRANPIYAKIANGRCGKLRTRIQTVDKSKIRRDELKKSQYTIISNIPGTVVELAP